MKLHLAIAACAAGFLGLAPLIVASPARAQAVTSNPVTQPLPPEEFQRLNRALLELAKRPRSLTALLDAGDAAIAVGDLDAAIGFFGRARELDPGNPNVSLGLASVYLRSGRPMTALPLFAEAREGGATPEEFLSDEALALDMVGDQAAAQAAYARVLATKPDDKEARRRLALSYAITGNATDFETTLRPLIDRRDFGAFRTRAFGLAIMGEQARAAAIVDAVMRRDLAGKITPYLEFMPRLTPAQQAAAANLGVFPRAADIGRDSPEIAAYRAGETRTVPAQAASSAAQRVAGSRLEPTGEPLGEEPSVPAPVKAPVQIAKAAPERVAAVPPQPRPQPQAAPAPQPQSQPQSQPEPPARVADAFGDLLSDPAPAPDPEAAKAAGAVDIAAIKIPREQPEKAEPEPEKPVHPRRIWVQLATGRDLKALGFDWRRFARKAPDLLGDLEPYTVPWGQANRLLAGPVPSAKDARELVNALKQKGLDTFSYTSPEGTEIQRLGRK